MIKPKIITTVAQPLLIRPNPFRTEGPKGYSLRLAEANWIPLREVDALGIVFEAEILMVHGLLPNSSLDPDLHTKIRNINTLLTHYPRVWNHQSSRFCPICLAEDAYWRIGWELLFYDACPQHGVWLIDQCSSCGEDVSWNRQSLVRCQCGSDLRAEKANACPENVRRLSILMENKLHSSNDQKFSIPFEKTNIEQTQRLIRYFGTYMDAEAERNPLKIQRAGSMVNSWAVTSLAAEVVFNWPTAFQESLQKIQSSSEDADFRRLNGVFGRAYHYLYRGLQEAAFHPVRQAFEEWLSSSWRGGLAKRNRRLAILLLDKATWIPATLARDTLGISDQRLLMLIREGVIEGEIHFSRAGRKFVMVRRDQLDLARDAVQGFIDMKTAGGALGLTKKRMRQILRYLFPEARKTGNAASMPWSVPRSAVESLLATTTGLGKVSIPDEGCVSIGHILRYWAWTADEIVSLIRAACSKEVVVINLLDGNAGVSGWIFHETTLKAWKAKSTMGYGTWLTVTQMAKILSIKQQVAYDLVKGHFINGETLHKQPKGGIRVSRVEVESFKQKYIFCTEIAQQLGVSPRKARSVLAGFYIHPISGPGIDNARQLLYFRNDELEYAIQDFVSEKDQEFRLI